MRGQSDRTESEPHYTEKELRIMRLHNVGYTFKDISEVMNVSVNSIKSSMSRARKRMEMDSTREMIEDAYEKGLL